MYLGKNITYQDDEEMKVKLEFFICFMDVSLKLKEKNRKRKAIEI